MQEFLQYKINEYLFYFQIMELTTTQCLLEKNWKDSWTPFNHLTYIIYQIFSQINWQNPGKFGWLGHWIKIIPYHMEIFSKICWITVKTKNSYLSSFSRYSYFRKFMKTTEKWKRYITNLMLFFNATIRSYNFMLLQFSRTA